MGAPCEVWAHKQLSFLLNLEDSSGQPRVQRVQSPNWAQGKAPAVPTRPRSLQKQTFRTKELTRPLGEFLHSPDVKTDSHFLGQEEALGSWSPGKNGSLAPTLRGVQRVPPGQREPLEA